MWCCICVCLTCCLFVLRLFKGACVLCLRSIAWCRLMIVVFFCVCVCGLLNRVCVRAYLYDVVWFVVCAVLCVCGLLVRCVWGLCVIYYAKLCACYTCLFVFCMIYCAVLSGVCVCASLHNMFMWAWGLRCLCVFLCELMCGVVCCVSVCYACLCVMCLCALRVVYDVLSYGLSFLCLRACCC